MSVRRTVASAASSDVSSLFGLPVLCITKGDVSAVVFSAAILAPRPLALLSVVSVRMMVVPVYWRHATDKQEPAAMTPMKAFPATSVLVGMPIRHATCTVTRKWLDGP